MKPKTQYKNLNSGHLPRIIILVILIGVAVVSISLTADSTKQMREHHTNKVFTAIDGWLNVIESDEINDRSEKINAFYEISDYQFQLKNHLIQCETIDSEFTVAFNQIVDWFYNNYLTMINETAKAADENVEDMERYFSELSGNIVFLSELVDFGEKNTSENKAYRTDVIAEFNNIQTTFEDDDFASLRIDENKKHVKELTGIISLMEDENIIDNVRFTELSEMINSLINKYSETDNTAAIETENILSKLDTALSSQITWFEGHYSQLIDEISIIERKDEYDDITVKNQIKKLEKVKQLIEDDAVVCSDFIIMTNGQIEELVEEYETDLASITERIETRRREAERAAAAAAARRNAASTSSNSTSNTSASSSGSSSSSSSSSSSGTQNQSGTVTASHNNRYPSISSNCREMLARLVKLEAPNESADGKQAVAEVVLNRMISSRWNHANTVEEVIFDTRWGVQFTVKDLVWTERGTPRAADYAAVDRALAGPNVLSKEYMSFSMSAGNKVDVIWIGLHAFGK